MLTQQLVFGCSRLVGGASAQDARRLVRRCLDGEVRHFDTAPSYGMGTAEDVIGDMVGDQSDVRITAKVGSPRPNWRWLRTCLRAAKRAVAPGGSVLEQEHRPIAVPRRGEGMDFDPAALRYSLELSRRALKRNRFDLLLMHESYVDDATPAAIEVLTEEYAAGRAAAIGYSHGAPFDPATDAAFPPGFAAQTAVRPEWLAGAWPLPTRPRWFHSIAKSGRQLQRRSPRFAEAVAGGVAALGPAPGDIISQELGVIFSLAHAGAPDAHLIFASADLKRLDAFLSVVAYIDRSVAPDVFGGLAWQLAEKA